MLSKVTVQNRYSIVNIINCKYTFAGKTGFINLLVASSLWQSTTKAETWPLIVLTDKDLPNHA